MLWQWLGLRLLGFGCMLVVKIEGYKMVKEEEDLDTIILSEIKDGYKTVRRICEDLKCKGIEVSDLRVDRRLYSLRKFNLVDIQVLDFPIQGPKPFAYKLKA